jgi:hypothetical protein
VKGSWESGLDQFLSQVKRHIRDSSKLHVIKGWFSDTLTEDNPALRGLAKVALLGLTAISTNLRSQCLTSLPTVCKMEA